VVDKVVNIRAMEKLAPPHSHFLSAAEGWLGLGDVAEARAELARIEDTLQQHPAVLDVRWIIYAHEEDWPAALALSRKLVKMFPKEPSGWLHQAYALRRVPEGGLQAAWNCLFPALEKFPAVAIIPYNLACYACQLRELERATALFKRALATGDRNEILKIALADADLQLLWAVIQEL
jgi:tetratricopeptide (TPR) repeat protein